jgi:hypothetical protein
MPKRVMHLYIIRYYYLFRNGYFQYFLAKRKGTVKVPLSCDIVSYFTPASCLILSLSCS